MQWVEPDGEEQKVGIRIVINHFKQVKQATWHGLGDYLATVMPDGANRSVVIHQLSKRLSQFPFSKSKGLIQCVLFHPIKPQLFVAVSCDFSSLFPVKVNCDSFEISHLKKIYSSYQTLR